MRKISLFFLLYLFFLPALGEEVAGGDSAGQFARHDVNLQILSGNNQSIRAGRVPAQVPVIFVTDHNNRPLVNEPVYISRISPRSGTGELSAIRFFTDTAGKAYINLEPINEPGDYEYLVYGETTDREQPAILKITIRKSNWVFLLVIGLFGGLSFFILGMTLMSEGMQNSAGNRMRGFLGRLTSNRFIALSIGALVTIVIQSSSATNVMLISFVNSKLMRFKQTIGVILGAAIGTTITAQIIAFKLTDYALLFVALGFMVQILSRKLHWKEIGKAILGFGILFFGMHIMSESMAPLRSYDPFIDMILRLQNPVLGIVVGALLTALIQSSSAFIGILIILSMQGLLTLGAAIPLLIGANIGTAITAVLASLNGSREAKQVALAHTLIKIIGAAIIVFLIPSFIRLMAYITPEGVQAGVSDMNMIAQPRQIANAHTLYNIALCLLFLPITNSYARLIRYLLPLKHEGEVPFTLRYINEGLLKTPVVAIDSAREELARMMKKVYHMTEKIIAPFIDKKSHVFREIEESEREINFLRDEIKDFLIKVSQGDISKDTTEEAFIMMNAVREFEQIADTLSTQLLNKAKSWCNSQYQFSDKGKEELLTYHRQTLTLLVNAIKLVEHFDLRSAIRLKEKYDHYREEFFELERQHYDRLKGNIEHSLESSKTHLEIITLLRVISSHAINTIRILIYKTNHHKSRKR